MRYFELFVIQIVHKAGEQRRVIGVGEYRGPWEGPIGSIGTHG